jgi:hypothetical protein
MTGGKSFSLIFFDNIDDDMFYPRKHTEIAEENTFCCSLSRDKTLI